MEYRGVRYAIRIGIDKGRWQLAVYLPDSELLAEKPVIGTRQNAEIAAHAIIDAWLKSVYANTWHRGGGRRKRHRAGVELATLGKGQKSESAGGETGGRGGLAAR
jgi:hypothetical protein